MMRLVFYLSLLACLGTGRVEGAPSVQKPTVFRGKITMNLRNGGRPEVWRYRFNAEQMRVDRPGNIIPSPAVNLLDFKTDTLSILHPHNGSWEKGSIQALDQKATSPREMQSFPQPPPIQSEPAPKMEPPPGAPQMPEFPANMPAGIGPNAKKSTPSAPSPSAGGFGGGMPSMPVMPMMGEESKPLELEEQYQTNTLFGVCCVLYKTTLPRQEGTLLIWAATDPALPSFYLPQQRMNHHQIRMEWQQEVAQLLRKKKRFPFHLTLQTENKSIQAEWKVTALKTDIKEEEQKGIFQVPSNMFLLPPPRW